MAIFRFAKVTRFRRGRLGWVVQCVGVAVCIVAYLFATIGMPITVTINKSKSGKPFPCQDHACGCVDADECWRSCCCFTPAQKIAWAKAHGVTPPDCIVQAAKAMAEECACDGHNSHAPAHEQTASKTTCCCDSAKSCCAMKPSCCAGKSTCCAGKAVSAKSKTTQVTGWVIAEQYRTCKGLPMMWVGVGAVLPPPAICEIPYHQPLLGHVVPPTLPAAQWALDIESPPPQSI
jgi:hypothetical protein